MKETIYSKAVSKLSSKPKYNLKDLSFAKYQKKYRKTFFNNETSHNTITTTIYYYGLLLKTDNDHYYDITNNLSISSNEISEISSFTKNLILSLEDIKELLSKLEEENNLWIEEKVTSGKCDNSYNLVKYRVSKNLQEKQNTPSKPLNNYIKKILKRKLKV